MAEPKKKMRLTFLWADESTLIQDWRQKISKQMVEWANDFYGPYGFELDVSPKLDERNPLLFGKKYCLKQNEGIRPDPDFELSGLYDELLNENSKTSGILREIDILRAQDPQFNNPAISKQIDEKFKEIEALRARVDKMGEELDKLRNEKNYDRRFRIQIGLKFLNEKIISSDRLVVVFCKYISRKYLMMRKSIGIIMGEASGESSEIAFGEFFVWPQPVIFVNTITYDPITLAHELVHTTGRLHPPAVTVIRNLDKYLNFKPAKMEGGIMNRAMTAYENQIRFEQLFRQLPGGMYDGPKNYILNYNSFGLSPSEVTLQDIDVERFKNVFYVI